MRRRLNKEYPLEIDIKGGASLFEFLSRRIFYRCIDKDDFSCEMLTLYWHCSYKLDDNSLFIFESHINKLMKEFVSKPQNKLPFLKSIIRKQTILNEMRISFEANLDQMFSNEKGNYKPFEDFFNQVIKDNSNDRELKSIKKYWDKYKNQNYKEFYGIIGETV